MRVALILFIAGCSGGLAALWQPPPEPVKAATAASVMVLSGRIAIAASVAEPRQVAPRPKERLDVIESAPLVPGYWLVRTRLALAPAGGGVGSLPDLSASRLDELLRAAPKALIGLRLDDDLEVIEDHHGLKRQGRVVRCDGDPVAELLHLRACLALAVLRGKARLAFQLLPQPPQPTGLDLDAGGKGETSGDIGVIQRVDGGVTK
jgi:hypothetical protein